MALHEATSTHDGFTSNSFDDVIEAMPVDTSITYISAAHGHAIGNGPDSYETADFELAWHMKKIHNVPRFGHSDRIAKLSSSHKSVQLEYTNGIKDFHTFVLTLFVIWGLILILFKSCGVKRAGCAAGGGRIDIMRLSKAGIKRNERKKRILRSWRTQSAFLVAAFMVPVASTLLVRFGLFRLASTWDEIEVLSYDIEAWAFRGVSILKRLSSKSNTFLTRNTFDVKFNDADAWCTAAAAVDTDDGTDGVANFRTLLHQLDILVHETQEVKELLALHQFSRTPVDMILTATGHVNDAIDWSRDNDWKLKFFLMVLNVITFLLLGVCYVFTKNNIMHAATRAYTSYVLLPLFMGTTVMLIGATTFFGVSSTLNADFCAGGDGIGSPAGTIEDAILLNRYGSLDRSKVDAHGDAVLEYFQYFSSACLTENPTEHLYGPLRAQISNTLVLADTLSDGFAGENNPTLNLLGALCQSDLATLPTSIQDTAQQLRDIDRAVMQMNDWTACHEVSPFLRRVSLGDLCTGGNGAALTCIWVCLLAMTICVFVMWSTRAALYNGLVTKKKSKAANTAKEFEEYKKYMSEFYDDTDEWSLQAKKKEHGKVSIDFGPHLKSPNTFETESSGETSSSGSGKEGAPSTLFDKMAEAYDAKAASDDAAASGVEVRLAGFNHHGKEKAPSGGDGLDNSDKDDDRDDCDDMVQSDASSSDDSSSYYSSSSDNSSASDNSNDQVSLLSSFVSETSSFAKRTATTIRSLPSLFKKLRRDGQNDYGGYDSQNDDGVDEDDDDDEEDGRGQPYDDGHKHYAEADDGDEDGDGVVLLQAAESPYASATRNSSVYDQRRIQGNDGDEYEDDDNDDAGNAADDGLFKTSEYSSPESVLSVSNLIRRTTKYGFAPMKRKKAISRTSRGTSSEMRALLASPSSSRSSRSGSGSRDGHTDRTRAWRAPITPRQLQLSSPSESHAAAGRMRNGRTPDSARSEASTPAQRRRRRLASSKNRLNF